MLNKLEKIYLDEKTSFTEVITSWANTKGFEVEKLTDDEDFHDNVQGAVLFHENYNLDKRVSDWRDFFDKFQVPIHKVDLSGTMNVAISHYSLFLERERCKSIAIIGSEDLLKNEKFAQLIDKLV